MSGPARSGKSLLAACLPGILPPLQPAEADGELLDQVATPDKPGRKLLADAAAAMRLSARGFHRVVRVARTIADLAGAERVGRIHVAEALSYRRHAPRN
jgi:magnesium chelatase family protein